MELMLLVSRELIEMYIQCKGLLVQLMYMVNHFDQKGLFKNLNGWGWGHVLKIVLATYRLC